MAKFLQFLQAGLQKDNQSNKLGDRTTYIGASDIGVCLRKAYLEKKMPPKYDYQTLVRFLRGHIAEEIVKTALEAHKINYHYQLELQLDGDYEFVKLHPDFVFCSKSECVVVECKSVSSIPQHPYESWMYQLQLQMFAVKKAFGQKVRSYILVIDIATGAMVDFEVEYNETLAQIALDRAETLWQAMKDGVEPEAEEGMLCGHCPFKGDCPKMAGNLDQAPNEIVEMAAKVYEYKRGEKEIKQLQEQIKAFMEAAALKKVAAHDLTISYIERKGATSIDLKKLKEKYPEIFEELKVERPGYSYIQIK